jgi:hypothetical protein
MERAPSPDLKIELWIASRPRRLYLRRRESRPLFPHAGQPDVGRKANGAFVLIDPGEPNKVLRYYTLCATSLPQGDVPVAARRDAAFPRLAVLQQRTIAHGEAGRVIYVLAQLGITVKLLRVALQPVEHRCRSHRWEAWNYTLGPPWAQKILRVGGYPEVEALGRDKEICQVVRRLMTMAVRLTHPRRLTAQVARSGSDWRRSGFHPAEPFGLASGKVRKGA